MPPELRLEHLSNSSVSLYADCGRAWEARYVKELASPATPPLVIGTAFDRAVETYLRARVRGEHLDLPTVWREQWALTVGGERAAFIDWQGELPEAIETQGAKLAGYAGTRELLDGLPVLLDGEGQPALQQQVTLRVPRVPVPVIGYVDVITADGVPGDFKTAARAWPDGKARRELQPRLYLAALLQANRTLTLGPGGGALFRHWVWTKAARTQIQVIETEFSVAEILFALDVVAQAWQGISAGVFMPNAGSWRCNEGCPVWSECVGRK